MAYDREKARAEYRLFSDYLTIVGKGVKRSMQLRVPKYYYEGASGRFSVAALGGEFFSLWVGFDFRLGTLSVRLAPTALAPHEGPDIAQLVNAPPPLSEAGNIERFRAIAEHYNTILVSLGTHQLAELAVTIPVPARQPETDIATRRDFAWISQDGMDGRFFGQLVHEQVARRLKPLGFREGECAKMEFGNYARLGFFSPHLICTAQYNGHITLLFQVPGVYLNELSPQDLVRLLRRGEVPALEGLGSGSPSEQWTRRLAEITDICDAHLGDVLSGEFSIRPLCEALRDQRARRLEALEKSAITPPHG